VEQQADHGHQLGLPVLYTFRRCPYAMRARLAIVAAGLKVEVRELVLRAKPAHMLEISPKGTVPVLWLPDGTVIDESLDVMHWAVGQNFPADWLVLNTEQQQQCDEWIALLDGEFKRNLDRYKYPHRYHVKTDTDTYTCDPLEHRAVCEKFWHSGMRYSNNRDSREAPTCWVSNPALLIMQFCLSCANSGSPMRLGSMRYLAMMH